MSRSRSTTARSSGSAIGVKRGDGSRLPFGSGGKVAGRDQGPRHRLGRSRTIPVLDPVTAGAQDLVGAPRVVDRALRAGEHGIDPRAQPVAAGRVGRVAHVSPVPSRSVCGIDQLVVLRWRAALDLEEIPGPIEQPGSEGTVGLGGELGGRAGGVGTESSCTGGDDVWR